MTALRTATASDVPAVAQVLTDAFVDDPVMTWVFPDRAIRPRRLQAMFGFLAEHVYVPAGASTAGPDAAALWLPFGVTTGDAFWEEHGEAFVVGLDGDVDRLVAMAGAMEAGHPSDAHWYLLAIGVQPSAQGRGLGGEVLRHTLALADERHEAAYLEATSPRSRVLYERHGFEATGELAVQDCPPIWPMWRAPR